MASFYKTAAAVCLLALCGLQSEAAAKKKFKFTVEEVKEEDYIYANFVRNGKLPTHISEVAKDQNLVQTLRGEVEEKETTTDQATCDALIKASNFKTMFHHAFEYASDASPDYRQLLQDALDKGLSAFNNEYPKDDEAWKKIWTDGAGASLAYLLKSTSTKIGCVIGKCTEVTVDGAGGKAYRAARDGSSQETDSASKNAVLFCELSPAAEKNSAPFDAEYFNGLIARTAKLAEMTADDLKAPVEESAATTAGASIIIAGLVAMLAAASA